MNSYEMKELAQNYHEELIRQGDNERRAREFSDVRNPSKLFRQKLSSLIQLVFNLEL